MLALAQAQAPVFEIGLSPGEGRPVLEARGATLALRAGPWLGARVTEVPLSAPRRFQPDSARFRTTQAGWVRARDTVSLKGKYLPRTTLTAEEYYSPTGSRTLSVARDDSIEVLQYRAEGFCFVRQGQVAIETMPCPDADDRFEVLRPPVTEWWVLIRMPRGPAGWVRVDGEHLVVVDRTF